MVAPVISVGDEVTADLLTSMISGPLTSTPLGMIARGRRTTSTGNITTTETGVLRIDGIPVYANRAYAIQISNTNIDTSVSNDSASMKIRISTSGAATTASTQIGELRTVIDDAATSNILPTVVFYFPTGDATLSILSSLVRVSGTGNIIMFGAAVDPMDMVIFDLGLAPGDSGVVI